MKEQQDGKRPSVSLVNETLDNLRRELGDKSSMMSAADLLVAFGDVGDEDRYIFDGSNIDVLADIFRRFDRTLPAYLPGKHHRQLIKWLSILG
ncbi:MAG: hypothetical protein U9Q03_00630 [Patescibacteria group bacterium]|nr:hypothetical protein [Patescibacteria group bacterium]